jgi:hypothetical protein
MNCYRCSFHKMPKVNNHPIGENSSSLVTLFVTLVKGVSEVDTNIYCVHIGVRVPM